MRYTRSSRPGYGQRALVVAAMLACLTALPARAQRGEVGTGGVKGVVRDSSGTPVEGALVTVRGTEVRGESGAGGEFVLAKASAGPMTILVRRIGFFPESATVNVLAGTTVTAEFALRRVVVALTPVVIMGRREITGRMAGFYQRMSRGHGHFFTREQIDKRNPANMTDLFRMIPGARVDSRGFNTQVRFRGARCAPLTWLDGSPLYAGEFDLDSVDPRSFEGIEIYSGAASVPAEYQGNRSLSSACGTIILWSKQGELRPKKRKKGELSPAAEIAQLVQQLSVFTADQVDQQARVDSSRLQRPVYPDSLYNNLVPGRVLAEFVVDSRGSVNLDTFNVVTTTHPGFVESVRLSLRDQAFYPAVRKGQPVQQVVQLPFTFVPDSTAGRKR
ncbi:MAG TPA: carboxypeptidase regulatory-like domain-containing protein [Gemmatimonadaceae bacterium]|nr:carboxypeptidase regulatory-like domain-containing protein [Gemmatimonadaceae bacterium]